MTRTVIISADQLVASHLETLLEGIPEARLVRTLYKYPEISTIELLLRTCAPEVFILDFQLSDEGMKIATEIQRVAPGVQLIGYLPECDSNSILPILRSGVREILSLPLDQAQLASAILHSRELLNRLPPLYPPAGELYCFVPVTGGVGSTTIAVNTALALAQRKGVNPLLVDFDLNAGLVRFHLNLHGEYCTEDVVERADQLDESTWNELVTKVNGLDVIHTGRLDPYRRLAHSQILHMTDLALRIYSHVVLDFSPNLEHYAQCAMRSATQVFLVSTPEVHAIYLAREKIQFLKAAGLDGRISLVLNRAKGKSQLSTPDVARLVDVPLAAKLPNDYPGAQHALKQGHAIKLESDLGKSFQKFSKSLCGEKVVVKTKRFSFGFPLFGFAVGK